MIPRSRTRKIFSTTQGKVVFVTATSFVVISLMLFFAIRPAVLSITNQTAQNQEKREYLELLTKKESVLKQLATQESERINEISLLNSFIPDGRNDEFVLGNLATVFSQNNCLLNSSSFGENKKVENPGLTSITRLNQVPVNVSLSCNLSEMAGVLRNLETLPLPISINNVSYGNKNELSMSIGLDYYFWN